MPANDRTRLARILTRGAAAVVLPLILAACPYVQRVDLPQNGRADAANCITVRGGDAERAATGCEHRGFARSPMYKTAYLEMTECVRKAGGDAALAVEHCRASL